MDEGLRQFDWTTSHLPCCIFFANLFQEIKLSERFKPTIALSP